VLLLSGLDNKDALNIAHLNIKTNISGNG